MRANEVRRDARYQALVEGLNENNSDMLKVGGGQAFSRKVAKQGLAQERPGHIHLSPGDAPALAARKLGRPLASALPQAHEVERL